MDVDSVDLNVISENVEEDFSTTSPNDLFSLISDVHGRANKRQRTGIHERDLRPIAFVRFNTKKGKPRPVTIKALLDSGAADSIISEKFCKKLKQKTSSTPQVWNTPAGPMTTNKKVKAEFTIPELQDNQLIEWDLHVTKDLTTYDMIIGRNILEFLKIDIRFSDLTVQWDHTYLENY